MALLYYQNLQHHRPDVLMRRVFHGLKDFNEFLQVSEKHLSSDHAVKRLGWAAAFRPDGLDDNPAGFWISLEPPEDRPSEPEATFRAFLDEDAREVYESAAPDRLGVQFRFNRQRSLRILDRDPAGQRLLLERQPSESQLLLRPNTNTLRRQQEAIACLQDTPSVGHRPLLRLLESHDHARWPELAAPALAGDAWKLLLDLERPGTDEQRRFVEQALHTTDFMLLEGPPGSGKTTAICELILQMAEQGKRVLLCASTHVAVDNVLEKLMDARNRHRDQIIPIRIGDTRNVSEKARKWQLETFRTTERKRLQAALSRQQNPSQAQRTLLDALRQDDHVITELVLSTANLTCGTTTGILQHPDLKRRHSNHPPYDMLILDEASKTTFHEFLVPAVLAKRWVIVGDPLQLAPFVDDQAMAANLDACLPKAGLRNACVDAFMARHKKRGCVIANPDAQARQAYMAQANALGVKLAQAEEPASLEDAWIVLGAGETLGARLDELPLDATLVRGQAPAMLERRAAAARRRIPRLSVAEPVPDWSMEVAWRINAEYEQRHASQDDRSEQTRIARQIEALMPVEGSGATPDHVNRNVDRVRKVVLPSILESLQEGFGRNRQARNGNALSDGLPEAVLASRHVRLSHQHRMHPDIAAFSHQHIYQGQALFSPARMTAERTWSYDRYPTTWRHVKARYDGQADNNPAEVEELIAELKRFERWAGKNRRDDGHPWEVAVLTYYRGQERALRNALRKWSANGHAQHHFARGAKGSPFITLNLCTVDRFQGHEADLVLLSLVRNHITPFLRSPNRLNVALTRARYCRIIVGDRHALGKDKDSLLGKLAAEKTWETSLHEKH